MKKTINEMGRQRIEQMIDNLLNDEKTRNDILYIIESKDWKALYADVVYKYFDYSCSCAGSRRVADMISEKAQKIIDKNNEEIKNIDPDCCNYYEEDDEEVNDEVNEEENNYDLLYEEIMRFTYSKLSYNDWNTLSKLILRLRASE